MRTAHKTLKTFILKKSYGTFLKAKSSKSVHSSCWNTFDPNIVFVALIVSFDLLWYIFRIRGQGWIWHWNWTCLTDVCPSLSPISFGHIRYKHLVLQKMLVEEIFYCFLLFFFLQRDPVWTLMSSSSSIHESIILTQLVMPWWQGKY